MKKLLLVLAIVLSHANMCFGNWITFLNFTDEDLTWVMSTTAGDAQTGVVQKCHYNSTKDVGGHTWSIVAVARQGTGYTCLNKTKTDQGCVFIWEPGFSGDIKGVGSTQNIVCKGTGNNITCDWL